MMTMKSRLVSRRTFVEGAAAVAGASSTLLLPALARGAIGSVLQGEVSAGEVSAGEVCARRGPVVTFYMDRPYLDMSGTAEPYISPAGTRSGQALAELSDEAFFSRFPY